LIAGRRETIERIRRNPLFRALRADKLIYAALEATLREYLFERWDRIPALAMIRVQPAELRKRAERLASAIGADAKGWVASVEEGESLLGGGSTPEQTLPTFLVAIEPAAMSAAALERRLRGGDPPLLARVEKDRLLLDPRTLFPEQEDALVGALRAAQSKAQPETP
jgi:L-seryl-tRNA(Ser) seleniumtransferase